MTGIDLDAIRERVDAATPGPWENAVATYEPMTRDERANWLRDTLNDGEDLHLWAVQVPGEGYTTIPAVTGDGPRARFNAEFIAHARTDVAALLAEVARLRAFGVRSLSDMSVQAHEYGMLRDRVDYLAAIAERAADVDGLARLIHETGPCNDGDCTDPEDFGYCDKRAAALSAWLLGGKP